MAVSNKALSPGTYVFSGSRDYRVVKPLGSGGFGITYLVECDLAGGVTAYFAMKEHFMDQRCERAPGTTDVKYSRPVAGEVEQSLRDFIAEANRLQSLAARHANIVNVHEIFQANNTAYYIMEFLEGRDLRSYVEARGCLSPAETRDLLTPIADALGFLHSNSMTHLDVKPDNIMLSTDPDGSLRPVLIDFGLSKHYDGSGRPTSSVNITGCSNGYSPIEQYGGLTEFQPTADIYALGATMMFCLTGRDPRISTELLPGEVLAAMGHIPGNMPLLVEAMMASQRTVRPQTMRRVLDALAEPAMVSGLPRPGDGDGGNGPVPPPPPPMPPIPPAPKKSHTVRNVVIGAAAVLLLAVAGAVLFAVFGGPDRHSFDGGHLFSEYTGARVVSSHSRFLTGSNLPAEAMSVSMQWDFDTDIDLVAVEPGGSAVYFGNRSSRTTGGSYGGDSFGGPGSSERITWSHPTVGTYYFFARTTTRIDPARRVTFTLYAEGTEDTSEIELRSAVDPSTDDPEFFLLGSYDLTTATEGQTTYGHGDMVDSYWEPAVSDITDETLRRRTSTTGGSAPLKVLLSWSGRYDLDLFVNQPGGTDICYLTATSSTGARFGGDSRGGPGTNTEYITWTNPDRGRYDVFVRALSIPSAGIPVKVCVKDGSTYRCYSTTLTAHNGQGGYYKIVFHQY